MNERSGMNGTAQPSAGASSAAQKPRPAPTPFRQPKDIECWGHRGASAHLPENTLASFRAAILEGADAIESDVHATSDGVIVMFHDPTLDRTTNGKGLIKTQPWAGVIEHVRTTKEPVQPIPLFSELVDMLMEPENSHVSLNIDCKMNNDPEKLFPEMARIVATHPDWQTRLAPRLILGLWHPLFLRPALTHLPLLRRYHIGFSLDIARTFFWDACEGFSIAFAMLMGSAGQAFIRECRAAGKEVCTWTVNHPGEIRTAMAWGIKAILTDKVGAYAQLKREIVESPEKLAMAGLKGSLFGWSSWRYYSFAHVGIQAVARYWVGAHGALPNPSDLQQYLALEHTSPAVFDTSSPAPNDAVPSPHVTSSPAATPALVTTSDSAASRDTSPTSPTSSAAPPPRRRRSSIIPAIDEIVPESVLTWIDTTAANNTAKLFS